MTSTRHGAFRWVGFGLGASAVLQLPILIAMGADIPIIVQSVLGAAGSLSFALSFLGRAK